MIEHNTPTKSNSNINNIVMGVVAIYKLKRPQYLRYLAKALLFYGYFITSLFILFPVFLIRASLPGLGRWKYWKFHQALFVFFTRHAIRSFMLFRFQPLIPRENGLRERGGPLGNLLELLNLSGPGGHVSGKGLFARPDIEWFPPPPIEVFQGFFSIRIPEGTRVESPYYAGPALVDPEWTNVRTRGLWFMHNKGPVPKKGPLGSQKDPIILFVHGGSGVTFAAGDPFLGHTLTKTLVSTTGISALSVDYYLGPYATFPVQVIQTLAVFLSLVNDYGYTPGQIYLCGDSFGGFTVMLLERYLRCEGSFLLSNIGGKASTHSGIPGVIILSPLLRTRQMDEHYIRKVAKEESYDIIDLHYLEWCFEALKMMYGFPAFELMKNNSPYISPYDMPSDELVQISPMFLVLGGLEKFFDEDLIFAEKVKQAGGNITTHVEVSLMKLLTSSMQCTISALWPYFILT